MSEFPEIIPATATGWAGIWDAWWMYLLALLLFLLLLLLLLAYLLYRLGKSALARFLLASALASLILVAIFIAMLDSVLNIAPAARELTINIVEEVREPIADLTAGERELLIASIASSSDSENASSDQSAAAAVSSAIAAAASVAEAVSAEALAVAVKRTVLSEKAIKAVEVAENRSPSALPLENRTEARLERRERRERQAGNPDEPAEQLPELSEPPSLSGDAAAPKVTRAPAAGQSRDETRPEIVLSESARLPIWSDPVRLAQPLAEQRLLDAPENPSVEGVSPAPAAARSELRPRRRERAASAREYPEPRREIPDPARDVAQSAAERDEADASRPEVEEIRIAQSLADADATSRPEAEEIGPVPVFPTEDDGRKTETLPDFAVLDISSALSSPDDADLAGRAADRGSNAGVERRRGGGTPARREQDDAVPETSFPGNADRPLRAADRNEGARFGGGLRESGDEMERRIDSLPAVPSAAGGTTRTVPGQSDSGGSAVQTDVSGPPAPSPAAAGATDPVEFSRPAGVVGGAPGSGDGTPDMRRSGQGRRRDSGQDGADAPEVPDLAEKVRGRGGDPSGHARDGEGRDNRTGEDSERGRGGGERKTGRDSGEGRFFDPGAGVDEAAFTGKGESLILDSGRAILPAGDVPDGGATVRLPDARDPDWRRGGGKSRRRTFASAASSVNAEGLLLVLGDFARLPDSASENLFSALRRRLTGGAEVLDRRLSADDGNLSDCLLAVTTPAEVATWTDFEAAEVGRYLSRGGHIWLDAADSKAGEAAMRRLATAAGGTFAPLDASHQLADAGPIGAVRLKGGSLAAVSTVQGWRDSWRYREDGSAPALRFLIRALNFFLSGNAESGIELDGGAIEDRLHVDPADDAIPERLAGPAEGPDRVREWNVLLQDVAQWHPPAWSDSGQVSVVSDGEGGRALRIDLAGPGKGRLAFSRVFTPSEDLSRARELSLDAYYDGRDEAVLSLVFTVPAGGAWTDYETPERNLSPGWNRLAFRLAGGDFRPLSGGGFVSGISGIGQLGRLGFIVRRADPSAAAVILLRGAKLRE